MRKILYLTLAVLLILPPLAVSNASPSRFTALFCPECWTYLHGHGSVDMKGNCAACGKFPLELEVQTIRSFWCAQKHVWLQSACPRSPAERCCTGTESLAVVAKAGPKLVRAAYCPADRTFKGLRLPFIQVMACAECARPMVPVWAAKRAWYWCELEGYWAATPCPMDPVRHCCARHEGLLLATPEPGPIAVP
jgi:hypothetical protein